MATVRMGRETKTTLKRLEAFAGIVDSGGQQLSTGTGKRLRDLLEERSVLDELRGPIQASP